MVIGSLNLLECGTCMQIPVIILLPRRLRARILVCSMNGTIRGMILKSPNSTKEEGCCKSGSWPRAFCTLESGRIIGSAINLKIREVSSRDAILRISIERL